jgi:hypothetical protein
MSKKDLNTDYITQYIWTACWYNAIPVRFPSPNDLDRGVEADAVILEHLALGEGGVGVRETEVIMK